MKLPWARFFPTIAVEEVIAGVSSMTSFNGLNSPALHFGAIRGKRYETGDATSYVKANDRGGKAVADDDIVVVSASRTPFGKQNEGLAQVTAPALAYVTAKKTIEDSGIDPKKIDTSIWGNIIPSSMGDAYLPRTVGLLLGLPEGSTSKVVQRRCASGFSAIEAAAMDLATGKANAALAGGAESMSKGPLVNFDLPRELATLQKQAKGIAKATEAGTLSQEDANLRTLALGQQLEALWERGGSGLPDGFKYLMQGGLTDPLKKMGMFLTADQLAREKGIDRDALDALASESHARALKAQAEGRFDAELAPVTQADLDYLNGILAEQSSLPDGVSSISKDEGPRASSKEALGKLNVLDRKNPDARHTAASASQITDGAASVLMTTGKFARENGLKVLAKVRAIGNAGVQPETMGYGPVPAIKLALQADGRKTARQMDIVEINEAFSVVPEVAIRELGLDRAKVNPDGSGISLGHPLAATGARIVAHLVHELQRTGKQFGLGAACIGGGEGAAIIVENVNATA